MRIGMDVRILYGIQRGMARYTRSLIQNLARIDKVNEYFLFTDSHVEIGNSLPDHFRIIPLDPTKKFVPWSNTRLVKSVIDHKIDVFHFPYNTCWIFHPCRTIVTLHDIAPLTGEKIVSRKVKLMYRIYTIAMKRCADVIITDSQNSREAIISHTKISPNKIIAIPLGVDPLFSLSIETDEVRNILLHYYIDSPFILFSGGFDPNKNLYRLVEAYHLCKTRQSIRHKLVVVGNIPQGNSDSPRFRYYNKVNQLIDRLQLRDFIIFTGYIPDDDLAKFYKGADLFVFPSLYEGFGLPPLESMACGTPVIAPNVTSMPEIIKDAGIIVNPYDPHSIANAIEQVICDLDLGKFLQEKGIQRASLFNWRETAEATKRVYENV